MSAGESLGEIRLAEISAELDKFNQLPTALQRRAKEILIESAAFRLSFAERFVSFPDNNTDRARWGWIQPGSGVGSMITPPGPGDLLQRDVGKTRAANWLHDEFTTYRDECAFAPTSPPPKPPDTAPLHGDALAAAFGVATRRQAKRNRPPWR